jgi:nucleolar protein 9
VLDAALESPTVSLRSRKRLVISFIGQFHLLVDDRIGSRVADRCLAAADPYLKVFIDFVYSTHTDFVSICHFSLGENCSLVNSS